MSSQPKIPSIASLFLVFLLFFPLHQPLSSALKTKKIGFVDMKKVVSVYLDSSSIFTDFDVKKREIVKTGQNLIIE